MKEGSIKNCYSCIDAVGLVCMLQVSSSCWRHIMLSRRRNGIVRRRRSSMSGRSPQKRQQWGKLRICNRISSGEGRFEEMVNICREAEWSRESPRRWFLSIQPYKIPLDLGKILLGSLGPVWTHFDFSQWILSLLTEQGYENNQPPIIWFQDERPYKYLMHKHIKFI